MLRLMRSREEPMVVSTVTSLTWRLVTSTLQLGAPGTRAQNGFSPDAWKIRHTSGRTSTAARKRSAR